MPGCGGADVRVSNAMPRDHHRARGVALAVFARLTARGLGGVAHFLQGRDEFVTMVALELDLYGIQRRPRTRVRGSDFCERPADAECCLESPEHGSEIGRDGVEAGDD